MDDATIVLQNPAVADIRRLPEIWSRGYFNFEGPRAELWKTYYRPFTSTTFALNHFFSGGRPWATNAVNIALHGMVAFWLYLFLRDSLASAAAGFLGALLFAVHTVNVEAVAYASSRSDVLAALFILLGLRAYARGCGGAALSWQVLALFSKESSLLMPVYLFAFDQAFMPDTFRNRFGRLWLFFALSSAYVFYRQWFCPVPLLAPATDAPREMLLRVLSTGPVFLEYAKALFRPEPFKFCLTLPFAADFQDPRVMGSVLFAVVFAGGLVWAWRKNRSVFFGLAFFAISFLPYLQIVRFKPAWAEHYLYVPALGLVLVFAAGMKGLLGRPEKYARAIFLGFYVLGLAFLFHQTQVRNTFYKNAEVFYDKLSKSDSPYAFYGLTHRAEKAMQEGRWAEAHELLLHAEKRVPQSDTVHHFLGISYFQKKDYPEALRHFDKAYEVAVVHDPKYRVRSAMTLFNMGRFAEAAALFEEIGEPEKARSAHEKLKELQS